MIKRQEVAFLANNLKRFIYLREQERRFLLFGNLRRRKNYRASEIKTRQLL
jgi:hypothetical protein